MVSTAVRMPEPDQKRVWPVCSEPVMPCTVAVRVGRRIVVSQDVVVEAAMVSWLDELDRRETTARKEIAELRDKIAELASVLLSGRRCCPGWRSPGRR